MSETKHRLWCVQFPEDAHDVEHGFDKPMSEREFRDFVRNRYGLKRLSINTRIYPQQDYSKYNSSDKHPDYACT